MFSKQSFTLILFVGLFIACSGRGLVGETFRNPLRIATPVDPSAVTVGDVNGDGLPDILWLDSTSTPFQLHVLLSQKGGGYLAAGTLLLPANSVVGCHLADFNRDGKNDLICAQAYEFSSSLEVFPGNGDGSFQAPILTAMPSTQNYVIYARPILTAPVDLNNDGIPDIIVSNPEGPLVYLGDGKGGFRAPLVIGNASFANPLVADLNGDGKLDLFSQTGIQVAFGNGDGTFTSYYNAPDYSGAFCILHDMDGDGHDDAVCGYIQTNNGSNAGDIVGATDLVVLHGNLDGSFNTIPIASKRFGDFDTEYDGFGTFTNPIAVADLNGDGIPDVIGASGDGLAVLLGGPGLSYSTPLHYAQATVGTFGGLILNYQSHVIDMNGDGIPDIVACGPNGVYITYGRQDGTFLSANAPEVTEVIGYSTVADFNGDGIPDVIATGDTALKLSLGKGDGSFAPPVPLPNSSGAINFSTPLSATNAHILHGDFNGDGKQDVIAIGSSGIYQYDSYILFGHGDGTFSEPSKIANSSTIYPMYSALSDAAVFDINHDGRSDIVTMSADSLGPAAIDSALSNGDGSFRSVSTPVPSDPNGSFTYVNTQPTLADFNRDGKLDAAYGGLNNVYVVTGNGDGSFSTSALSEPIPSLGGQQSQGAIAVSSGDFDGDGNLDFVALVLYPPGSYPSGDNNTVSAAWVYFGNGNGTFSAPVLAGEFDRGYVGIATGDFNQDGLADFVMRTGGTLAYGAAVGVVHSQSSRSFGPEINYTAGTGLSSLSVVDLNGDGYPDLVFANGDYNIRASSVTVLLNSGAASTATGTLTSTPNPSYVGQPFTITATLTPPTAGITYAGSVTFYVDGNAIGSAPLSGNVSTIAGPTTLSFGTHQLTATWPGDTNDPAVNMTATHTVIQYPLQISLTCSPNPSVVGQSVTLEAQFLATTPSGVPASGAPYTGTLSFSEGSTLLEQQQVATAGFNYVTPALAGGTDLITASYSSDGVYEAATATCSEEVDKLPTTSQLLLNPVPEAEMPFRVMAKVSPVSSTTLVPTGAVTFIIDGAPIGSGNVNPSTGIATFNDSGVSGGSHTFSCTYAGDSNFASSSCPLDTLNLPPAPAVLSLVSSSNPAQAGLPINFIGKLSSNGMPAPGDTINFTISEMGIVQSQGSATTDITGNAMFRSPGLAPGTYTVSATFAGTANLQSVSSPLLMQLVVSNPTTTALTASPNPGYPGEPITLTATVATAITVAASTPAGVVTFFDGTVALGSATLNSSGVAIFTTTSLGIGIHSLTASYATTTNFSGSTSLPFAETILNSGFTITLSPGTITLVSGKSGTATINLSSVGLLSGPLALTYGMPPTYASAAISPTTVTLAAGGSASSTVTVTTLSIATNRMPTRPGLTKSPFAFAAAFVLFLPLLSRRRRLTKICAFLVAAVALQSITGCTNTWHTANDVAPGTYVIPVTATDVNHNSQTANLTVIVTP